MPDSGRYEGVSLLARTRGLMSAHGLRPVKSLGQNFLIDENVAARVVAASLDLEPARIIEIGPGLGALTVPLASTGLPFAAFEKDPKLAAPLGELLAPFPDAELVMGDFLEADLADWQGSDTVAVGNLPYYITTPIIEKLMVLDAPLRGMVLTMQREVADRMRAREGSSDYGSLTVWCRFYIEHIEPVCTLSPNVFLPRPEVNSSALRLVPRRCPPAQVRSPAHFFRALRGAFGYRRKTLRKALSTAPDLHLDGGQAEAVLALAGISPKVRAETLGFDEFAALGNALWEHERAS